MLSWVKSHKQFILRYLYFFACDQSFGAGLMHPNIKSGMELLLGLTEQSLVYTVAIR